MKITRFCNLLVSELGGCFFFAPSMIKVVGNLIINYKNMEKEGEIKINQSENVGNVGMTTEEIESHLLDLTSDEAKLKYLLELRKRIGKDYVMGGMGVSYPNTPGLVESKVVAAETYSNLMMIIKKYCARLFALEPEKYAELNEAALEGLGLFDDSIYFGGFPKKYYYQGISKDKDGYFTEAEREDFKKKAEALPEPRRIDGILHE